MKKNVNNFHLS